MKFAIFLGTGLIFWSSAAMGQQAPPIFPAARGGARFGSPDQRPHRSSPLAEPRTTVAPSASCKAYTFEGLPDRTPIPQFDGISANGWDSGISETAGGTAQFINAPSGITVAVFLGGGTDTINFTNPVQSVQYYYATAYATTLTAYDSNGTVVAGPVQIQPNWDGNPAGYEVWTQIATLQAAGNVISSLAIQSTAVLNNFLGIDNLNVCTSLTINSVEMTQAIQQFQVLGDLKNSLSSTGEPPVPIISGKPGVMRIYVNPPLDSTTVSMEVSGPGSFDEIKHATLQPGCQASDQRVHNRSCPSTDFYFTPPSGTWTSTISVRSPGGALLEQEALTFRSRDTQPLVVRGVSVCDFLIENTWICGHASDIVGKTGVLEKIAPTNSVTTTVSSHFTRREITPYCPNGSPGSCADNWWDATVRDISRFYFRFQSFADINGNMRTQLSGIVNNNIPGGVGGIAASIPGYAVMTRSSTPRFTPSVDTIQETLAHEHGHALGLKHTNSGVPQSAARPGCYFYAQDPSTNWPWKGVITSYTNGQVVETGNGNNEIQSTTQLEVGFDVAARTALDPTRNFEIMSYCSPRWIAPQRYKTMINNLGGGLVTSPSSLPAPPISPNVRTAAPRTVTTQPFWMISGVIPATGPAQFDPMFQSVQQGDVSGGSGTYSLVVQNSSGTPLFTRMFTPDTSTTETDTGTLDFQGSPSFAQLIPVTAGASQIVLEDPNGAPLGQVTLGGAAPTVAIASPTANFDGTTPISWTIADPDSSNFDSRVLYSPDNGATWSEIGEVPNSGTSLNADFSLLPGTNGQGLIQVLVSDGVNTGSATSPNFTIAKKTPSIVQIASPAPGVYQPSDDVVLLKGAAYDTDDGTLSGSALAWSSNLQGALGTGNNLSVNLQPGIHTVTLTATDSDGNSINTSETVTITSQPPQLSVSLYELSAPPTSASTCLIALVTAAPAAANGAPLASVQYSVDGGNTYTGIPLNQFPNSIYVPGTGLISLVVQATDQAGLISTQTGNFFNLQACSALAVPNIVGQTQTNASNTLGSAGFLAGVISSGASTTVAAGAVMSQSPAAGVAVAAGSSTLVNFVVSNGPQVAVPNVVGQAQADAAAAITTAGLAVGTISSASSATVPAGAVIGEIPAAGTQANAGTTISLTVSTGGALAITSPMSLAPGTAAALYVPTTVTAMGGTPPYTWSATGLPAGLTIDPVLGAIDGTPSTSGGPYSVVVTVTDSNSVMAGKTYSLSINSPLAITGPATLPAGMVGAAYSAAVSAGGGSTVYSWVATGLPPGLRMGSTGTISGIPLSNAASPYTVQVMAQDSNGAIATASYALTIQPGAANVCAVTGDGTPSVADIQYEINEALGGNSAVNDLNSDGAVNAIDVQILIDSVLQGVCLAN